MSPSPQLAPPGSSTYDSTRMHIGDGTWDQGRDTFLLPNLVGLNFETTRYNGMGNRFREFANYHSLITAHAVLAALTFLAIVPAAIMIARFYHRNPRTALRMHIMLQILTVALATVVLILGWQAVGPPRSLTNPHHGIGLALYVLILIQAIGGALIHHIEKKKMRYHVPLKLYLHQWLGRVIALLGITQVALGLTLYGSPKYLFILYALVAFAIFLAYFILSYRNQTRIALDDRGSYMYGSTTDVTPRSHRRPGLGTLAAAGVAGAGLGALGRRRSSRNRLRKDGSHHGAGTVISSHHNSHHSGSFYDEKYTEDGRTPHKDHTWRNRLLGGAAGVGALAALRGMLGGRRGHDRDSDVGSYSHPLGGAHTVTDVDSRVEEGNAPATLDDHWRRTERLEAAQAAGAVSTGSPTRSNRIRRHRRSGDSISSSSSGTRFTGDADPRHSPSHHGVGKGIMALGVLGYLKHTMSKRKQQQEERRVEELRERDRLNSERINRAASKKHRTAGSSIPPVGRRHHPGSFTDSEVNAITGSNPALSRHTLPGQAGAATAGPSGTAPPISMPPPGLGSRHDVTTMETTTAAGAVPPAPGAGLRPPPPLQVGSFDSSGSEAYTSPSGREHQRHRGRDTAAAAATGAALGAAAAGASGRRTNSRHRDSSVSMADPPVSVKVKMHQDGRHVTLKRLTEEEAAAERDSRRRERLHRRHRGSSLSSIGGTSGDERWRRTEARERAEAQQLQGQHNVPPPGAPMVGAAGPSTLQPPPPTSFSASSLPRPPPGPPLPSSLLPGQQHANDSYHLPPPPPIPASGLGSHGSPQSTIGPYGTGTETDSKADSNRRRRRAERARARQSAQGGDGTRGEGGRVEFT